ncbi:MAG TPA: DNA-binding response regulator, partial [Calditrichaeota bacterium]|nr:DNA-binding response regulator [Calditrichota bacterium]
MHRIIVIDDDPAVLHGILFNLEEKPQYEVLTAASKQDAIKMLK